MSARQPVAEPRLIRHDQEVLRRLAWRRRDLSERPTMAERRQLWRDIAALRAPRPMVLTELREAPDDLVPTTSLECVEPWARDLERQWRLELAHEQVDDDYVFEAWVACPWQVQISDFGVAARRRQAPSDHGRGAEAWDAPLQDLDRDFDRLQPRTFAVDRPATQARHELLQAVVEGICQVRRRGWYWWSTGLTWSAIDLIGLEGLMYALIDNPAGVRRLMAFLRDDKAAMLDWFEREGLLTLNNENDSLASGTLGYTDLLPRPDRPVGATVCTGDVWGFAESQETVAVSPRMFEELVLPYQLPLLERFGLTYYGCCEPLHERWSALTAITNLRRVSLSPWCDQEFMARALGDRYVFCRKPHPALVSCDTFDEQAIRSDLRTTLETARGCQVELSLKDVHTLRGHPERMRRWVELAREAIDACWRS